MPEIQIEFDRADYQKLIERVGDQIREIVTTAVTDTADLPGDEAAEVLHTRIAAVEGMQFDRAWSQNIIDSLRRGENVNIHVG